MASIKEETARGIKWGIIKNCTIQPVQFLYGIILARLISPDEMGILVSILFAIGVTWFVGSFSWKSPSRLLIWLGGSGLFTVYMFHLLPMRIITALQFNLANPFLIWFCVIATTAVLAISFNYLYKIINNILFIKT